MTVTVTLDVTCDWCGHWITGTSCGPDHSRIPLDHAHHAATLLEARVTARGTVLPSPPGRRLHLCAACTRRGTPPATNHAHRTRVAAERRDARRAARAAS